MPETDDIRVVAIAYNNRILERMEEKGLTHHAGQPSANALIKAMRRSGLLSRGDAAAERVLRDLIGLRIMPKKDGSWVPMAEKLAAALECSPEELFPLPLQSDIPKHHRVDLFVNVGETAQWNVMESDAHSSANRWRIVQNISPREMYDATVRIRDKESRVGMDAVRRELNANTGLMRYLTSERHPLRLAYMAAKNYLPFPESLS